MRKFLLVLLGLTLACVTHGTAMAHGRGGSVDAPALSARHAALAAPRYCGLCRDAAGCALGAATMRAGFADRAALFKAPRHIVEAVEAASRATGADFFYLLKTAALESSFDPDTEAATSSAVGLYQFVEQTWLYMVREVGAELGVADVTGAITAGDDGYEVADPEAREEILRRRYDVELSAILAGLFTRRNAAALARALGREPDAAELYIAHVMGAAGAAELIRITDERPNDLARKHFPRAARANRPIFFEDKRARTAAEVYELLKRKYFRIPVYADDLAPWTSAPLPVWEPPLPLHRLGGDEFFFAMR